MSSDISRPIVRWDAIMSGSSSVHRPAIYVEPTAEFLDYAERNDYMVPLSITGTGSDYDGTIFIGTVDKSSVVPNCRPNFYNATDLYVVTLHTFWYGYPHSLGVVNFKS